MKEINTKKIRLNREIKHNRGKLIEGLNELEFAYLKGHIDILREQIKLNKVESRKQLEEMFNL